jgi:hypothetical protein
MRWTLLLLAVGLVLGTAIPSSASSLTFSYIGTVSSDTTVGSYPYVPLPSSNLTGQPISITESFYQTVPLGYGQAQVSIGSFSGTLIGNTGNVTPIPGGFSSVLVNRGYPFDLNFLFGDLNYSSTFTPQTGLVIDASLELFTQYGSYDRTLTFNVTSETFVVSPVPLPPALPMFAAALLALGIVSYVGRKREVKVALVQG